MAKTQTLSNTFKAAVNMLIDLGNQHYSYIDEGIVGGGGIWFDALRDETPVSPALAARAITKLVKDGVFIKSEDEDNTYWISLTDAGAKKALAFKDDTKFEIVEEAAAPVERKAPTAQSA